MNGQGSRPAEAQWERLSLLRLTAVYGLRIGGGGLARRLLEATDRVEVAS